jgi:hypothetical protein
VSSLEAWGNLDLGAPGRRLAGRGGLWGGRAPKGPRSLPGRPAACVAVNPPRAAVRSEGELPAAVRAAAELDVPRSKWGELYQGRKNAVKGFHCRNRRADALGDAPRSCPRMEYANVR